QDVLDGSDPFALRSHEQIGPDVARGSRRRSDAEQPEERRIDDLRLVGVAHRRIEERAQPPGFNLLLRGQRRPSLYEKAARDENHRLCDRDVRTWMFLRVGDTDLDRVAIEPWNRASRVEPLV